jgi:hypothetical protein
LTWIGRTSISTTTTRVLIGGALALFAVIWSPTGDLRTGAPLLAAGPTARFETGSPCRLADVRDGTGFERVDAKIVRVVVAGRCGVPINATAVALTVTVDNGSTPGPGHVTVWPDGVATPTVSALNYSDRQVRANGVVVGIGVGGAVNLLSLNGAPVIVDVTGWFVTAAVSTSGRFVPIAPTRAIDTREAPRSRPLGQGEVINVPLPPGVPADASALAVTLTTTQSAGPGFLTAFPATGLLPPTSSLNTDAAGQTRAAGLIVAASPDGLNVYSLAGGHVIVDVTGWFTGASAVEDDDGLFVAEPAPRRLIDTRFGDPLWANGGIEIANVTSDAAALVVNVTIINPFRPGHLIAHPARQPIPLTSTVNGITSAEVAASMAVVPTSAAGIGVYSSGGADLVVDVTGWFIGTPPTPIGGPPTNLRPPDCTSTTDPGGLNDFFRGGAALMGADYQRAFTLPDGRILWFFQDPFIRGRYGSSTRLHNAALVQSGTCFTLLQTGNFAAPRDYLFADQTQRDKHWFWPMSGDMGADGMFHLFVAEMRENGPGYLTQTEPIATWAVTINPATLQVTDRRLATNSSASLYGWSVTSADDYTYLYAHCHRQFGYDLFPFSFPPVYVHDWDCADELRVARVPKGRFDLALEYWTGSTWSLDSNVAVNVIHPDRLVSASQIYWANGTWIAVTKVDDWWGDRVEIDVASQPQGPFTTVRTIPTPAKCSSCNTYFASLLPYRASDGSMIIGLSNNLFGAPDLSRYDPTFFTTPSI